MTEKCKRAKTEVSKASSRSVVGLRRKFGEDVLAHLSRSWELHGKEILELVMTGAALDFF